MPGYATITEADGDRVLARVSHRLTIATNAGPGAFGAAAASLLRSTFGAAVFLLR